MPHTQNSILFGDLLCRRYKSHDLRCDVMSCTVIFCSILTVIPPVKQPSVEVLCYNLLFCLVLHFAVLFFGFISVPQHLSLCISKNDFDIIQFNILCFPVLFSRVLSYFPAYAD